MFLEEGAYLGTYPRDKNEKKIPTNILSRNISYFKIYLVYFITEGEKSWSDNAHKSSGCCCAWNF